jgi:hypothetical protein
MDSQPVTSVAPFDLNFLHLVCLSVVVYGSLLLILLFLYNSLFKGQSGNSQPTALVVQGPSSALSVAGAHKSAKSHTVLQPTQNSYGGQQFIVTCMFL